TLFPYTTLFRSIIFKLPTNHKSFEKCSSKIGRDASFSIQLEFFLKFWCYIRGGPTQFHDIHIIATYIYKVFYFSQAQAFVHCHCISCLPRFLSPFRNVL